MYGENRVDDALRLLKAVTSNQLARLAPRLYVEMTHQTGRGAKEEQASEIASYFRRCFEDFFEVLGVASDDVGMYLRDKHVLEYGPGDVPGVALLMFAYGASRVTCVDRFHMVSLSEKNIEVIKELIRGLEDEPKQRAESCFVEAGDPASGFAPEKIDYLIKPSGLSGLNDEVDLVISRAVLEHVNNLGATFSDMHKALRNDGIALHQIDLKSHGLHRRNPLDFLTWPTFLWNLMYSHKGVPNRLRVNQYRAVIEEVGFEIHKLKPTMLANSGDISEVRPHLAQGFRDVNDEDLAWLGIWLLIGKKEN